MKVDVEDVLALTSIIRWRSWDSIVSCFSLSTPMLCKLCIKSMGEGGSEIIWVELVQDATKICLDSLVRLPLEARPALISAESLDHLMSGP